MLLKTTRRWRNKTDAFLFSIKKVKSFINTSKPTTIKYIQLNNLPFTLQNIIYVKFTVQEFTQIQEFIIPQIVVIVSDHHQFQDHAKIPVLNPITVIENSILFNLHHSQVTLNFLNNEEVLDSVSFFVSEIIVIVLFLDLTREIDRFQNF